jgi:MFS family permease
MGTHPASVGKAILALYAMNFLNSMGFGAFGVIVPLYMRDTGVSFVGLGLAFGVFGVVMGIAGMFFGAHSDVVGRKPYLVLSLALRVFTNLFYINAQSLIDFVILQALSGVSASLSGAIVPALMTDLTMDVERGRKFGRMGGYGWLGTGSGYFLGGVLSQIFGYNASFIFLSVLTAISCVLILGFVPSYRLSTGERFHIGLVKGFSPNFKIWLLVAFATALVIGPVEAMVIPTYAVFPGPLGIDKILFGSFMSAGYILTSSTQFIGGSLADKYNRRKLASLFYLLSAPFILVQPFYLSFVYFALMYVLEGFGEGLFQPCANAMRASSVRTEHRGFDFSILNLLGNVGGTIGFIGMGYILDTLGFVYPFVMRAIVYFLIVALIYVGIRDSDAPKRDFRYIR